MVAIKTPGLHFLAGIVILAATSVVAGRHRYLDSSSVALSTRGYDEELGFTLRDYGDERLSARELSIRDYIDDKIELALRHYDDQLEELFGRVTREEIAAKIAYYTAQLAITQQKLNAAVEARKAADKALKAKPNDQTLQEAFKKAKNYEKEVREYHEHNQTELEDYQKLARSPSPDLIPPKPKGL